MAVIVVLAASPMALAQRAGFQIGISQPAVALPPVQAPAIATRGTFIGNSLPIEAGPIVIIQNQEKVGEQFAGPGAKDRADDRRLAVSSDGTAGEERLKLRLSPKDLHDQGF